MAAVEMRLDGGLGVGVEGGVERAVSPEDGVERELGVFLGLGQPGGAALGQGLADVCDG